jgi:hypothetical protein
MTFKELQMKVDAMEKEIATLKRALSFLDRVKIEGHGRIVLSGGELKINANTDLQTILNRSRDA